MSTQSTCHHCQQAFGCGVESNLDSACWCIKLPNIASLPEVNTEGENTANNVPSKSQCLCPECLKLKIAAQINTLMEQKSLDEMLVIAAPFAKPPSMVEGIDFNLENGFHVFTSWFHLKRGSCCSNGCKNCPYSGTINAI